MPLFSFLLGTVLSFYVNVLYMGANVTVMISGYVNVVRPILE